MRKAQLECPNCGGLFTSQGYRRHKGTKRCANQSHDKLLHEERSKAAIQLKAEGKSPINTNVATALKRRGCDEVCGITREFTKVIPCYGDIKGTIDQEYWAYNWVVRARKNFDATNFYAFISRLKDIPKEEVQDHIAFLSLMDIPKL